MGHEAIVYVNGRLFGATDAHVSPLDRGFALGDGLFETMRARRRRVFRVVEHLARLRQGAKVLSLPLSWSDDELAQAIAATVEGNGLTEAIVRLSVSRGVPEQRGLLPPKSPRPTLVIQAMPFTGYPLEKYQVGFAAVTASMRRNDTSPLSGIKSSNYLDNILARMEAERAGADDALLLNTKGELACATASNLFLVRDGHLLTPALESGALPGITRRAVIELAARLDLPLQERPIAPEELTGAQEAFLTNTLMGVMPLVRVDGEAIGEGIPGEVTQHLRSAYQGLVEEELS